ncbi:biopolymer transporter ExbD [Herbaspirillum rubrisubalbicans]|uniref:Biopolymer transporter ExbD n=2 Tax=Herbaspirillum rubrisubalbicans TaxID=80842 RepID=A0ABX9C814_9BURK|nr:MULTISPECIES: biopolymer transporter ExbD [Herbaspirillum]MCP1572593.1 biopolymer transport protein ExbD [Herbaspirillum rubrisubalbicans]QJQ01196.1 biopolymer transporter ExbD [Herbaspirillum rubrisubalbicans Os34]RAM67072.1 biopolymer transporter ExbD [Herbaspirillum rubrisubalbicans]RAN49062.1 biopolymer transporter ExbD [Herbaspirillum rubrisubalbicans]
MAMQIDTQDGDEATPILEMNMTPLIDVMLVLIIMFIITIPIQNHMVNLNMPVPAPPTTSPKLPAVVTIDVTDNGKILWNGTIVASEAELEARLRDVAQQQDQDEVHLRPNSNVAYRNVAAVLAAAQRLEVKKLGIVGNERYLNP